ncbi:MAG: hypothetical protein ABFS35_06530 [Bacteroidota bacterium]
MDIFLNSLQYTIPSIVVMLTAYLLIKQFYDKEIRQQKHELLMNNQKLITPVRLQAYERMILLLERISPENLLTRVYTSGMTINVFKASLLQNIRSEFDHNLSQQIYISSESWDVIKLAKENMVKLLNIAAKNLGPSAQANDLSRTILEMYLKVDSPPLKVAIEKLKNEFSNTFNN